MKRRDFIKAAAAAATLSVTGPVVATSVAGDGQGKLFYPRLRRLVDNVFRAWDAAPVDMKVGHYLYANFPYGESRKPQSDAERRIRRPLVELTRYVGDNLGNVSVNSMWGRLYCHVTLPEQFVKHLPPRVVEVKQWYDQISYSVRTNRKKLKAYNQVDGDPTVLAACREVVRRVAGYYGVPSSVIYEVSHFGDIGPHVFAALVFNRQDEYGKLLRDWEELIGGYSDLVYMAVLQEIARKATIHRVPPPTRMSCTRHEIVLHYPKYSYHMQGRDLFDPNLVAALREHVDKWIRWHKLHA